MIAPNVRPIASGRPVRGAEAADAQLMRVALALACLTLVIVGTMAASSRARSDDDAVTPPDRLVESYLPPPGDRAGDPVRGRAWTYDSAITAAASAARGDLDAAGAVLDALQSLQREDGALESSYDLRSGEGAGPLRAGTQAWVGLAALQWRARTCSGRHDRMIAGVARWLLAHRIAGNGLVVGGPDVAWASTEHNLEARAFFAGLVATLSGRKADRRTGRRCPPGLDGVASASLPADASDALERLDQAIATQLFAGDHMRQGLHDDARPIDVQALGILWLLGKGRRDDARAVARYADAAMWVHDRPVDWPGAQGQTFSGYRPFADDWGPDVLWMEGTLMMRLAKARLGQNVAALDDVADRWAALSAPLPPLQADRAVGGDYHAWPAAAPAAWLALSRSGFGLL